MINHGTIGLGVLAFVVTGAAASVFLMARSADTSRSVTSAPFQVEPEAAKAEPFAVVELFTSEGCSSCPPADTLLSRLGTDTSDDSAAKGGHVYRLAFHVDYWDSLGHKDPFASAAYTERQRQYAAAFRERGLYTPQMVVNGSQEFVGSDSSSAKSAIKKALGQTPSIEVVVAAKESAQDAPAKAGGKGDSKRIVVTSTLKGVPKGAVVRVALTESGLSTDVKRGENSGRVLKHDAVVRAFATIENPVDGENATELTAPEGFDLSKARAVVFVQDGSSMKVFGAGDSEVISGR